MVRLTDRCKLAVLVLSLALLAPLSSAEASPLDRPVAESLTAAASRLAGWLTAWLGDVGCSWDPGGCPRTSQPAPPAESIDVGCSMDPGGCPGTSQAAPPANSVDVGCSMDPNGACGDRD
jgi:hypothetical protein